MFGRGDVGRVELPLSRVSVVPHLTSPFVARADDVPEPMLGGGGEDAEGDRDRADLGNWGRDKFVIGAVSRVVLASDRDDLLLLQVEESVELVIRVG